MTAFPAYPTFSERSIKSTYPTSSERSINSTYSATLTEYSQKYWRPGTTVLADYYYHVIQVNSSGLGYYSFTSNSSIQLCAFVYTHEFHPTSPCSNIGLYGCREDNVEVQFMKFLSPTTNDVLVITTFSANVTGEFTIIISGPELVKLTPSPLNTISPRPSKSKNIQIHSCIWYLLHS